MIETPRKFAQVVLLEYKANDIPIRDIIAKMVYHRDATIRAECSPRWVNVKDDLPKDSTPVVVTNNINSWKDHCWLVRGISLDSEKSDIKNSEYCAWDGLNKIWGVTHWLSLPEPFTVMGEESK